MAEFYSDGARVIRERPPMTRAEYRAALLERIRRAKSDIALLIADEPTADDDGMLSRLNADLDRQLKGLTP